MQTPTNIQSVPLMIKRDEVSSFDMGMIGSFIFYLMIVVGLVILIIMSFLINKSLKELNSHFPINPAPVVSTAYVRPDVRPAPVNSGISGSSKQCSSMSLGDIGETISA